MYDGASPQKYETSNNVTEESYNYNNRHILTQRNLDCCIIAITVIMALRRTTTINVIQSASMAYGILVILAVLIL
jgi:hypothetical protein